MLLGVFGNEHHIHVAVAIEVGHAHMLIVTRDGTERTGRMAELAGAIVEVQPVGAVLHRHRDIQVAVTVGIQQRRIQGMQLGIGRHMGGGDVGEQRGGRRRWRRTGGDRGAGQGREQQG